MARYTPTKFEEGGAIELLYHSLRVALGDLADYDGHLKTGHGLAGAEDALAWLLSRECEALLDAALPDTGLTAAEVLDRITEPYLDIVRAIPHPELWWTEEEARRAEARRDKMEQKIYHLDLTEEQAQILAASVAYALAHTTELAEALAEFEAREGARMVADLESWLQAAANG